MSSAVCVKWTGTYAVNVEHPQWVATYRMDESTKGSNPISLQSNGFPHSAHVLCLVANDNRLTA